MSVVNNAILTFSSVERAISPILTINAYLAKEMETTQGFLNIHLYKHTEVYGGSKVLEADIHIAAFNHIPLYAVQDAIASVDWSWPEVVRLFWKGQHDEAFEQKWPKEG